MRDANPNSKEWKRQVAQAAGEAMAERGLEAFAQGVPLALSLVVYRARPTGHFGTGRNAGVLKASAPSWPTTIPDLTKLLRGIEDALKGVVYHDDGQIVAQWNSKRYGQPRAEITVTPITGGDPDDPRFASASDDAGADSERVHRPDVEAG